MIDKTLLNKSRSLYYGMLSKMLIFQENSERFFGVKDVLPTLIENPLDENTQESLKRIYNALMQNKEEEFIYEYDSIFYLVGGRTVKMTASYYDEGIEFGKKLLEVKNFLAKTKIRRNEKLYKETEDNVGFLFLFMHEIIELIIGNKEEYEHLQHCIFTQILNPFIDTFTKELFEHKKSDLYKDVAIVLNGFMEFERLYFDVPKCELIDLSSYGAISKEEMQRRAINKAKKLADKAKQEKQACLRK